MIKKVIAGITKDLVALPKKWRAEAIADRVISKEQWEEEQKMFK